MELVRLYKAVYIDLCMDDLSPLTPFWSAVTAVQGINYLNLDLHFSFCTAVQYLGPFLSNNFFFPDFPLFYFFSKKNRQNWKCCQTFEI